MATESRRGCGYRKVGGLYLVGGIDPQPCGLLPLPLYYCPTCGAGIKQSRGWSWINPGPLFDGVKCTLPYICGQCSTRNALGESRVGLLWIGESFYPTPEHFTHEASEQGISRRIPAVPRGFQVGRDFVFFAHPKACRQWREEKRVDRLGPGVIGIFRPSRVEKILDESDRDDDIMRARLASQGITPVYVPDDDPDHH